MHQYRDKYTATVLDDCRVLVCGGRDNKLHILNTCEFYLPDKQKFVKGPKMHYGREGNNAIKLKDGRVLIASEGYVKKINSTVDISEIYDPKTNSFETIDLNLNKYTPPNLKLMPDGKVLMFGFRNLNNESILLFDSDTQKIEKAGKISMHKHRHGPVMLNDEEMLIIGGNGSNSWSKNGKIATPPKNMSIEEWKKQGYKHDHFLQYIKEIELFNIKTGKSKIVDKMPYSIWNHQSILLNDGRILILPGSIRKEEWRGQKFSYMKKHGNGKEINIYNPKTKEFKALPYLGKYQMWWNNQKTGILLDDGRVFFKTFKGKDVKGLRKYDYKYFGFIFDPKTDSYKKVIDLKLPTNAIPVKLKDGNILIMGGQKPFYKYTKNAELIIFSEGE